jgi:ArsR family transcriptional regulator
MAKVFKALSNPNRLELYLQIVKAQKTSYENSCECLTISHNLKELSNAELIFTERKGKFVVARINEVMVNDAKELLKIHQK